MNTIDDQMSVEKEVVPKPVLPTVWIITTLLLLITVMGLSWYIYDMRQNKSTTSSIEVDQHMAQAFPTPESNTNTNTNTDTNTNTNSITWVTASNLPIITFDYPYAWHVASTWEEQDPFMRVTIDPQPYNGAPRGGPPGAITISLFSKGDNVQTVFEANIERSKSGLSNIQESRVVTDHLEFTRIQGEYEFYETEIALYHAIYREGVTENYEIVQVMAMGDENISLMDQLVKTLYVRPQ